MSRHPYRFGGTIGSTVDQSVPWWPAPSRPPKRSPNIVMIVLDDVGFAQLGCYGGDIATPNINRLATNGAKYTGFNVTALCSPTRASLLTGRNHHAAGMGLVANFDNGFPGYRGYVSHEAATIAEMLGEVGYVNYAVGKWHLVPPRQMGPVGPFDQWPLGRGFDHYYGFLHGKTDQWTPALWEDNHSVEAPPPGGGYHLSEDLADKSIGYLGDYLSANTSRPFFLYLAFGAGHDPHQVPREHIERYQGQFDDGWDAARDRIIARQKAMGIIPGDTLLPPPNPGVPAWSELSADEKRLFARMEEVFAGFLTHADEQVGRLTGFLDQHGLSDDTLVVVLSDNGASMEGGRYGYVTPGFRAGRIPQLEDSLEKIDELGGPATSNIYPAGWAQAGNTPLRFYKMHTHGGGVRTPLVMHWPDRIKHPGVIRDQYHHVVDVVPTILEELGIAAPAAFNGVPQLPVHGTSMAYTFDDPGAKTRKHRQYFEIHGHRGLWQDGWKAIAYHEMGVPFAADRWELYHLDRDFSESTDLAEAHPEKLAELTAQWWVEAGANGVLPLEDRTIAIKGNPDSEPRSDKDTFTYLPGAYLPDAAIGPDLFNRNFRIAARVDEFTAGDQGVLLAIGEQFAGFAFFIADGQLVFDYNASGRHSIVTAPLTAGPATLFEVAVENIEPGTARAALFLDGKPAADEIVTPTLLTGVSLPGIQCGRSFLTPVSDRHGHPFAFTGKLHSVTVSLEPKAPNADELAFRAAMRHQ